MRLTRFFCAATCLAALAACDSRPPATAAAPTEDAPSFVRRVNAELDSLGREVNAAAWVQNTYITPETELLNARAGERWLASFSRIAAEARAYDGQTLDESTARSLYLLKLAVPAPAPADAAKRNELAALSARLAATYGEAKACHDEDGKRVCRTVDDLNAVLATSRDYDTLTRAWTDWHDVARPMRKDYERFVTLANEGSREIGFDDVGAMWRAGYDMSPEEFGREVDRLWEQVRPLYVQMHCYARTQLAKRYGEDRVPEGQPIPAQLFGNMWAQVWTKIYPDILQPYPAVPSPTADAALKSQGYDGVRMARSAEAFYTSLGFPALPQTFWQRSLLTRPRDRDVECHPSAWHIDAREDVRIKQCLEPTEDDLTTLYHEMGHVYYFLTYKEQPFLFQNGAHDGFHEAIGDTVVLSMTPAYMQKVGLRRDARPSREATLNEQMKLATDRIAFLPFGLLVDQWRWQVFSGQIRPEHYNEAWWALREKVQGVRAPVARSEVDFDPGAKHHIPTNTPYTRYFLAYILQFQFHKALCEASGWKGPLHECSVYGNAEAGKRLRAMLADGASRPWPETLEKLTGTRQMDGSAIIEYFRPLMQWLEQRNAGQKCEWDGAGS
jgi:peptidyl-dipeptidase A